MSNSFKEALLPILSSLLLPLFVGFFLGKASLGGLLAGSTLIGVVLALVLANTGSIFNNTRLAIELGYIAGEKSGSQSHKIATDGDLLGKPLKSVLGPVLNAVVKIMAIIALMIAPLL